ncbi:Cof-type HAD-IIB family hydrolase [Ureaplasma zalophigenitalium]|uniref:Cof-type HAD-IIB family hydrolase n=1 Tax=Ureaplasma zalophigenitalium TaxID=907723 RepID=A0ABT3BNW7_9BACT|nr:HAD family hydrolase [Ureaplasma zalophigenitalium]MCV3753950.1 Cof-type HAD-IIB family hydrolase [Ureaplasma zalophigenitalium]
MKKVFAFDLDGTLFMHANNMHDETPEALKKIRQAGHDVIISTGRSLGNILEAIKGYEHLFTYIVASNGAVIYHVASQNLKIVGKINIDAWEFLMESALKNHLLARIDTLECSMSYLKDDPLPVWTVEQDMDFSKHEFIDLQAFQQYAKDKKHEMIQVAIRGGKEIIHQEYLKTLERFGDVYQITHTSDFYVDINAKNINKWTGILEVVKQLKLDPSQTIVFGDSGNDIQMLSNAGVGIAMGNATHEAKKVADIVIGECTTNAIAQTLLKLI